MCNDFRGILHPNHYWPAMTNVLYVSKEAKIACTHEMAGIIYTTHAYSKLYGWVPRGVPMDPKQLRLLVQVIAEGGSSITSCLLMKHKGTEPNVVFSTLMLRALRVGCLNVTNTGSLFLCLHACLPCLDAQITIQEVWDLLTSPLNNIFR